MDVTPGCPAPEVLFFPAPHLPGPQQCCLREHLLRAGPGGQSSPSTSVPPTFDAEIQPDLKFQPVRNRPTGWQRPGWELVAPFLPWRLCEHMGHCHLYPQRPPSPGPASPKCIGRCSGGPSHRLGFQLGRLPGQMSRHPRLEEVFRWWHLEFKA